MTSYESVPLRDLTTLITKGTTPSSVGCGFEDGGVNFIKSESVTIDGRIDESIFAQISEATHQKLRRSQLAAGDILFSIAGMKLGKSAVVRQRHLPANTNQALALIRPDPRQVASEYLHYWFLNPSHYAYVNRITAQAAQPNINLAQVGDLAIALPPLRIQRRIAGILSAYDDLIENCERRIRVLDEMARALYREWFVLFRYPGHEKTPLVDSPLGRIPKGWQATSLGAVARNFDRLRRPLSQAQRSGRSGPYPYYGAAKVFDYIDDFIFDGEYLLLAEDGSVSTPDGFPVLQLVTGKFWPNNHTHVLQGVPPVSTHYLYLALSSVTVSQYVTGAAQPKITQENMNRIPMVRAPDAIHAEFDTKARPLLLGWQVLTRQCANLRKTRDLLLPRLLSGQLAMAGI